MKASAGPRSPRYMICSTPRSGSTLLGRLMTGTGRLGHPKEYLNKDVHLPRFVQEHGLLGRKGQLDLRRYFDALATHTASDNGVFGLKAHFTQLSAFFSAPPLRRFLDGMQFIWITREDIVAQAVSFHIAMVTKQWSAEQRARAPVPPYQAQKIEEYLNNILTQNAMWAKFFHLNGIASIPVSYEALVAEPEAVIRRVAGAMGVTVSDVPGLGETGLARQGTAVNDEYCARFRADSAFTFRDVKRAA